MKFDRLVLSLLVLVSSAGHCQEKLPATAESQPQSLTAAEQKIRQFTNKRTIDGVFHNLGRARSSSKRHLHIRENCQT